MFFHCKVHCQTLSLWPADSQCSVELSANPWFFSRPAMCEVSNWYIHTLVMEEVYNPIGGNSWWNEVCTFNGGFCPLWSHRSPCGPACLVLPSTGQTSSMTQRYFSDTLTKLQPQQKYVVLWVFLFVCFRSYNLLSATQTSDGSLPQSCHWAQEPAPEDSSFQDRCHQFNREELLIRTSLPRELWKL